MRYLIALLAVFTIRPLDGAESEVTIYRDDFGVPHVFADTPAAAAYGVGLAQCEEIYKPWCTACMPAWVVSAN